MERKKTPTISDIARSANVSTATVSRALANSPLVTPETRDRIQRLAQEMQYVPNAFARGLVTNSVRIIGMIIPDILNPFFPEVAKGVEAYAQMRGFSVVLCNSNMDVRKERGYIESLFSLRACGIAIMPMSEDLEHIHKRFPPDSNIAYLSYVPENCGCSGVSADDFGCGYLAAEHLLSLGHRNIAFVGGGENRQITDRRYAGYMAALRKAHLEPWNESDSGDPESVLEDAPRPTAAVCYNDMAAIRLIESAGRRGLSIPQDLSVVGIDDIYLSQLGPIQLTTVAQDKYRIGEGCAKIIIDRVLDEGAYQGPVRLTVEPTLVVRRSTAPLAD